MPERAGETGIHGFCGDASGRVCYTDGGAEPTVTAGRCAPSCRDLPDDWLTLLLPAPRLTTQERQALLAQLDSGQLFPDQPAVAARVRALLTPESPSAPAAGRAHAHAVNGLAFTPDGTALITTSPEDSRATLWSISSRKPLSILTACDSVNDVVVTPDGSTAVTACRTAVKLWSLPDWGARDTLGRFDTVLIDLALDKPGKTLAAIARGHAALWQLPGGRPISSFDIASGARALSSHGALAPDGTSLVTGGFEQPTAVWALPEGKRLATVEEGVRNDVSALAVSEDGRTLAAGYGDGTVALWALPERRALSRRREHGGPVNSLAFDAHGRWLASAGSDHTVKVWELADGTMRHTLRGHANEVFSVAVSSAGVIASGDRKGVVLLWDLATGAAIGALVDPTLR